MGLRLGLWIALSVLSASSLACNDDTTSNDASSDAGTTDSGATDSVKTDSGAGDSKTAESGSDAGHKDAGGGAPLDGDGVRGGKLYDAYWSVNKTDKPEEDHPLWAKRPDTSSNTRTGADTWRCKECHGWDYKGVDGAYGSGSHATGVKGVLATKLSAAQIVEELGNTEGHAYGEALSDQDMADLAAFITEHLVDASDYIDSDGKFSGDADSGESTFGSVCAACHGAEGLNTMVVGTTDNNFEDFPGFIANDNPQEFLHKVRFGQPGTAMPALASSKSVQEIKDLCAFAQTLPQMP